MGLVSQTRRNRDSLSLADGRGWMKMIESRSRPTSLSNSTARSRRYEADTIGFKHRDLDVLGQQ